MSGADWLTGGGGLFAGLGSLLSDLAAFILAIQRVRAPTQTEKEANMGQSARKRSRIIPFIPGALLMLVSGGIFTARALQGEEEPLNVQLTAAAWSAFNKRDFERALNAAEKCIAEFRGSADREQAELQSAKAPLPPKGRVSDAEKNAIFEKGLLNDVATCFFIKGRAAENLGRKEVAREAFSAAIKYTYARCWDPKGWFWSPAEAAADRLAGLN